MKKTLLASALAAIALTASAQSEVARPAGEFGFVTKNLTVDGSIIPYSVVGADYQEDEVKFTIYDKNFNTVKSFSVPKKEYKYNVWNVEAKAPITSKETIQKEENPVRSVEWYDKETGTKKDIESLDDWKAYLSQNYGDDMVAFTDADGNWAFRYKDQRPNIYDRSSNNIEAEERYWYYKKEEKAIYSVNLVEKLTFSTENLTWSKVEGEEPQEQTLQSRIADTDLKDYDANCAEDFDSYLSQGLFNKDEKFELVVKDYKEETSKEDTYNSWEIQSIENDGVILRTQAADKNYTSYYSIINEDGKELTALPGSSSNSDFEAFKIDGKLYMSVEVYKDGEYQTIIYGVDNVNTSITELARTTPVAAKKFFNTQGVQVNKDAKGIVIQKGGAKYLNK